MSLSCEAVEESKSIGGVVGAIVLSSSSSSSSSPECSTTPRVTELFRLTPGGTRIMYSRDFLLGCRNSPLSKSPLENLPTIPGVTCDLDVSCPKSVPKQQNKRSRKQKKVKRISEVGPEVDQFQLEL